MHSLPSVAVVIVAFNRSEALAGVLEAYQRQTHPPTEMVVVDNASDPAVAAMIKGRFPEVRLLPRENVGFARAVNEAATTLRSDALILSPDDVIPEPTYVEWLARSLCPGGAHAVGGVVMEWPDTGRINTAGAGISTLLRLRIERERRPLGDAPLEQAIIAGSMAVRRDVFESLHGLHETFGAAYEDVDLSLRIRRAGGILHLAPRAVAYHVTHPPGRSYPREFLDRKNVVIFFARHAPNLAVLGAFLCYYILWATPRDLALGVRDARQRRAIIDAFRWVMTRPRLLLRLRREAREEVEALREHLSGRPSP